MRGRNPQSEQGGSLVEVLVAVALLAVSLAPLTRALLGQAHGATVASERWQLHERIATRMETVLAQPYEVLANEADALADPAAASQWSDAPASANRLQVFVARVDIDNADTDADPFSGIDDDVVRIVVAEDDTGYAVTALRVR